MIESKQSKWLDRALWVFILVGVLLALANLFHNRSLWMDEAMLALNIVNRSFGELLHPLDMNQVAPIGFLLGEKLLISVVGTSDLTLRILPFLSYVFAIPLFFWLGKQIFSSNKTALLAVAFFCINVTILSYASEVKQYSTDICIAILIAAMAIKYGGQLKKRSIAIYSLVGTLAVWFSNIAVIVLIGAGLYSLHNGYSKNPRKAFVHLIPIASWVVSFGVYYSLFIHNHPTREIMIRHFDGKAFLPQDILSPDFYSFLFSGVKTLFGTIISYEVMWPLILIPSIVGIWWFIRSGKAMYLYIILLPLFVHLGLSYLKMYPFHKRLVLYIIPFLMILFAGGMWRLYIDFSHKVFRVPQYILLVPVIFLFYPLGRNLPIEKEEIKKSLEYLDSHIDPEDMVYLYYASIPAFRYYEKDYPAVADVSTLIVSSNNRQNWSNYDVDLLRLSGTGWLIFSHVYPFGNEGWNEELYMIRTLRQNGYSILEKMNFKGASLYKVIDNGG